MSETRVIVVVTSTEDDSRVVRWYTGVDDIAQEEIAWASAGNLLWLEETPPDVLADAKAVHETLRKDSHADVSSYATHTFDGVWLVPVGQGEVKVDGQDRTDK